MKCINGHEVQADAKFCSECGTTIELGTGSTLAATNSVAGNRAPRRLKWWQVFAVFAVIGLVVYLAVVRPALNTGGQAPSNGSSPTPSVGTSAAALCFDSIAPLVDTLINNNGSDASVNQVALEVGTNDPRFRLSIDVYFAWSVEAHKNGRDSANLLATQQIAGWCQDNS